MNTKDIDRSRELTKLVEQKAELEKRADAVQAKIDALKADNN